MSNQKHPYLHYIIALVLGLVLCFGIQPTNGLTEQGVLVLAITIPTLYLWLTTNTHWTAFLYLGLLVMTQVMTPTEIWAGSLGHFVVITMVVFMVLNHALSETGVIHKVAVWFITRKFVQNRPYAFLAMFFASNFVIGMVMENMSLAVIYVGLCLALCEKLKLKKGDPFYTCIFLGTLWGNSVVGIASPIAHALPNVLIGVAAAKGIVISYGQWLTVGVPFAILMYIVTMICVFVWRPDATCFRNFDLEEMKASAPKLDMRGKISAVIFILTLLLILLPELLEGVFPVVCTYITDLGVAVPGIFAVVALCLISVEGKPILDMPRALQAIPLPAVLFAGVVSLMSTPLSAASTGISAWLGQSISPAIAGMSQWAILTILVIAALIMTNFLSNAVTMIIFFNLGAVLLGADGISMVAFTLIIGLTSSMAALTPSAAVPSPLFFGPEYLTMKGTVRHNLLFLGLAFVVIMVFVVPFTSALM